MREITDNPIKKYEHGYPCMLGEVVGRIVGESEKGSWGNCNGERMFSIPQFVTPHGTVFETGVLYLSEITEAGMSKLLEYETDCKTKGKEFYAGKWKPVDHTAWTDPDNKAGKYLADELAKLGDDKLKQRVGSYLHKFHKRMAALRDVENEDRTFFLQQLLNKTKADVRKNFKKTKLIATLLENVVVSSYRKELVKM